jgi:hypothetical protein
MCFLLFFIHSTRLCHLTSFMSSWIPTHPLIKSYWDRDSHLHMHLDSSSLSDDSLHFLVSFCFYALLHLSIRWDSPARRRASLLIAFSTSTIAQRHNLSISFQFFPRRDDFSTIHDDMMERTACRPNRALRLPCYCLPLQLSKTDIPINGDVVTRDTIELLVGPNHEDVSSLDE